MKAVNDNGEFLLTTPKVTVEFPNLPEPSPELREAVAREFDAMLMREWTKAMGPVPEPETYYPFGKPKEPSDRPRNWPVWAAWPIPT